MARAPALQAGGRGFEPHILHASGGGSPARFFDRMGGKEDTEDARPGRGVAETHERGAREARAETHKSDKRERAHGGCLWLPEAKKDAAGRERPRGGASSPRSAGVRMGQPAARKARHPQHCGGEPGEPKHPSSRRRGKQE